MAATTLPPTTYAGGSIQPRSGIILSGLSQAQFRELTDKNCSSFEIVAVSLWSHRARAINLKDNTYMELVFFANCQCLQNSPLPVGFYSNCFFPVTITISNQTLTKASNAEIVKLIQEAKVGLTNEFGKWVKGKLMKDPFAPPPIYTTMFISEWRRLGFNQVDYDGDIRSILFPYRFESHLCCHCWLSALYEKKSPINDMVR
ncbi:Acyl transferase 5 [Forsythia ovata]|uniref:Acyl transferase 5 n=1 Tax=Forsythia ovata TaxID=205694 RepID=A0ABD1WRI3_9LAMI